MISTRRDAARLALALASAGAGVIHIALGPAHLTEWAVLGWGFFVTGALQLGWAGLVVRRERLLVPIALLSLLSVGVWLVSRTSGLPLGPEQWQAESVGRADVLSVLLELAVLVGAVILARNPSAGRAPSRRLTVRAAVAVAAAAAVASTGAAVADPAHPGHRAAPPCAASAEPTGVDADNDGADDGVQAWFRCLLLHEHDGHKGYPAP